MPPIFAMSIGPAISTSEAADDTATPDSFSKNWEELRADPDIQFSPVEVPDQPPREPTWVDGVLKSIGEFLEGLFGWFPAGWPAIKWILIVVAVLLVLYILFRLFEPYLRPRRQTAEYEESDMEWQPNAEQSAALLEDADKLAAEGKYDEATHLLLRRSVTHMADAKPDWVEPSSTARELASIQALPDKARETFGVIAQRVEQSLFALRNLNQNDWEIARAAYADFAATSLRASTV